ncbi:hypothetical protein ES703_23745 [subsurface metagenome]
MPTSHALKSNHSQNEKPYLLVQYPDQGTPVFKFLNIVHPRFDNPGARVNGSRNPVHISKVISEVMAFVLGDESRVKRGCR